MQKEVTAQPCLLNYVHQMGQRKLWSIGQFWKHVEQNTFTEILNFT